MREIFLSASVPTSEDGHYANTADPFLIQLAVRELVIAVIREQRIVWGGHPSITPMIWAICEDLHIDYSKAVVLYQSRFFEDQFPKENERFSNVVFVEEVSGDREESLLRMRWEMLSRNGLRAAVFIGGMEGVEAEYALFKEIHPMSKALIVASPGGAARDLAQRMGSANGAGVDDIDFARLFHDELAVDPHEDGKNYDAAQDS